MRHAILLVVAMLCSCAALDDGEGRIIDSWRGANINDLMRAWGIPDRQMQLSDGGSLYEWNNRQQIETVGSTTGRATASQGTVYYTEQSVAGGPRSVSCRRTFSTDKDGNIVRGTSEGDNCCFLAVSGYCESLLNHRRR